MQVMGARPVRFGQKTSGTELERVTSTVLRHLNSQGIEATSASANKPQKPVSLVEDKPATLLVMVNSDHNPTLFSETLRAVEQVPGATPTGESNVFQLGSVKVEVWPNSQPVAY